MNVHHDIGLGRDRVRTVAEWNSWDAADATISVTLTVQDPARLPLGVQTTLDSISTPPMALPVK